MTKQLKLIRKVWQNKANRQKLVSIPKRCTIEPGDTVLVTLATKEDLTNNEDNLD